MVDGVIIHFIAVFIHFIAVFMVFGPLAVTAALIAVLVVIERYRRRFVPKWQALIVKLWKEVTT